MKIGILGTGGMAGIMAEAIHKVPQATVWAAASRNQEKADVFAKQHNIERAYGSYMDLVSDPEIDLVYIATPHSHHYEHMKLCITHGKPILCEKAFTQNAAQAKEVIAMAEEKGVFLTEAIWTRYMPMRKKLDEVLASGVIGKVSSLCANLCYPIMQVPRIQDPALAGGALLDIGVYTLNFASMTFGDDIERVDATAVLTDSGVDAILSMTLVYKDGKVAVLHNNAQTAANREGMICGENGYIIFQNINNCEGISVYSKDHEQIARYETPQQSSGYEYEIEACMEALKTGALECPQMPHAQTIRMMELMDHIREKIGVVYPNEK